MKKFILIHTFFLVSCTLFAQWTSNTELNTLAANSKTGDIQSVSTSDGKTFIAYWHDVPAPKYYEMRLQLLDENGFQLFGPEGMLVNNTVAMSSFTVTWSVCVDKNNNIYIGFTGTGTGNPAYIHKIAPDGTQVWGAFGISPGAGYDVKVLPLSNGEVIISWLPGNTGLMQKVAADGTAVWPDPVAIQPAVTGHKTSAGELAELPGGDVVVLIHDRNGFSPSSLPYAQRYDADGTAVWASPVALSNTYYTVFNRRYSLIKDGDVLYFGYAGAQGIQPHGFLQRIDPDGSLPWGINGSDFSTQTALFERDVKIAFHEGSGVVWAICEYSDAAQDEVGEYVQKFDKVTGNRLLSDTGKEIFPVSPAFRSHQGELRATDEHALFLISDGNSNGVTPRDILAVYLDTNGDFVWPEFYRPVATNETGVKSRIQLNAPVNGKTTAAWSEDRTGEGRAYAQQLRLMCVDPIAAFIYSADELETTFTSTALDADSISWSFGDNSTGTGNSVSHSYQAPGTYKVCQWVTNSCGTDMTCKSIKITCTLPMVGFTFDAFQMQASFTSYVLNADSILWNFGDNTTSTELDPTHVFPSDNGYEVCLYVFNACGTDSSCQEIFLLIGNAGFLEATYHLSVSPNPNNGTCAIHLDLPQAARLAYSLLSSTGQVIRDQSTALDSGPHDIPLVSDLPSGHYYVKVEIDGHQGIVPIVVR